MPKFSVMNFMYGNELREGNLTHPELLNAIKQSGGQGIEVFQMDYLNDPQLLKDYPNMLKDAGIEVSAIDVIVNLVYNSPEAKSKAQDELKKGIDICLALDADIAHIAGCSTVEGVTPTDGRKMIAELMLEQADFADQNDLILAIEDFDPSPDLICAKDDCLEILAHTNDRVKFVFDTGNFMAVEEQADDNLPDCYDKIVLCHFKDFVPQGDEPGGRAGTYFGKGVIHNKEVASMLVEGGYDKWVSLESYTQDGRGAVETVSEELPILRSMFGQ